ncbi:AraC-type DNA-binding protein [Filimonas lacunae]|uniref:AraC-type DNA-binding protein n=1 Tax=Filimonas lacunae TaxID=477680 RepID=A0A173MIL7_9BACT|nr:AraC family transcriptional regulator [Filimonas lacunae]BAV07339.1 transcriptional regulator, AraC family [Filimonas lacunae]SIS91109.1 AraC-type DNA-binding protein [Filimonas lacunae]
MTPDKVSTSSTGIVYSCYHNISREGEHFVPEQTLSYLAAGSLVLNDGKKAYNAAAGSLRFIKRNQLLKFVKHPPEKQEFQSLSIYLDQETLKEFSKEYGITAAEKQSQQSIFDIKPTPLIKSYLHSLLEYQQVNGFTNPALTKLKQKEALLLILEVQPDLKNILFDFAEPYKIDLESFMQKNYHFNVRLERFAYLTGRSLATFKRDFQKIFGTSPRHWLQQKRLDQARYLIQEKGQTASNIYLDLGFENLSHFSYAFKNVFGVSPTELSPAIRGK